MNVDPVEHEMRKIITARMVALVNIKRKFDRLYDPERIRHDGDRSVEDDLKVLEDASVTVDEQNVRLLRERFEELRELLNELIADAPDYEVIKEIAESHVREQEAA